MRNGSLFSLGAVIVVIVSFLGPACESTCGDSSPDQGSSCSGTARCGATCGEFWECKGGQWSVGVADCFHPGHGDAAADAHEADGGADTDAVADAACDGAGDDAGDDAPPSGPR